MRKVTVIPFQENSALSHTTISYFEISEDYCTTLCYVSYYNSELVIKRDISCNKKYAEWLLHFGGIKYKLGQYDEETALEYLFNNNHWFVSLEHYDQPTKYIVELQNALESMERIVNSLESLY